MGLRFKNRFDIQPSLVFTEDEGGTHIEIGERGYTMHLDPSGKHASIRMPEARVSFRVATTGAEGRRRITRIRRRNEQAQVAAGRAELRRSALGDISLELRDNGAFDVVDGSGAILSTVQKREIRETHAAIIVEWLKEKADEINGDMDLLVSIHQDAPSIDNHPVYAPEPFDSQCPPKPEPPPIDPKPEPPDLPELSQVQALSRTRRDEHELEVRRLLEAYTLRKRLWLDNETEKAEAYRKRLAEWERASNGWGGKRRRHEALERAKAAAFPANLRSDLVLMQQVLYAALHAFAWPYPMRVAYRLHKSERSLWFDFSLPSIEQIPARTAQVVNDGRRLVIVGKTQKQLYDEYAAHVCGSAWRLAGIVFSTLQVIEHLVLSGFVAHEGVPDARQTGLAEPEYLLSIRMNRSGYRRFEAMTSKGVEPCTALATFDQRISRLTTGELEPIEPFEPA